MFYIATRNLKEVDLLLKILNTCGYRTLGGREITLYDYCREVANDGEDFFTIYFSSDCYCILTIDNIYKSLTFGIERNRNTEYDRFCDDLNQAIVDLGGFIDTKTILLNGGYVSVQNS